MKCPLCSSSNYADLSQPGQGSPILQRLFGVPIKRCQNCNFMYADFIHPEVINFFYSNFCRSSLDDDAKAELRAMGELFTDAQLRFLAPHLPDSIPCALDYGGGVGAMTDRLRTIADEVWSSELDETSIENSIHETGVKFATDSELDGEAFIGKFDLIILSNVLEHMRNPLKQIARFSRLCRPGGLFFIEVPFEDRFVEKMGNHMPQHILFFNPDTLKQAITSQGSFDIVAFNQSGPPVDEMIAARKLIHRPEVDETENGWVIRALLRNTRPNMELIPDSFDGQEINDISKALSLYSMSLMSMKVAQGK